MNPSSSHTDLVSPSQKLSTSPLEGGREVGLSLESNPAEALTPQKVSTSPLEGGREGGLYILDIVEDTTVDGPGFRTSIYCAGCTHHCAECHNPQSWSRDAGHEMSVAELMDVVEADPFANVTFSGGDPMQQAEGFAELATAIKERTRKTIWCYTGYTYETLLRMPAQRRLLEHLDVLVDGPFLPSQKSPDLIFKGSSNQRIIDVPRSLSAGHAVLWQR